MYLMYKTVGRHVAMVLNVLYMRKVSEDRSTCSIQLVYSANAALETAPHAVSRTVDESVAMTDCRQFKSADVGLFDVALLTVVTTSLFRGYVNHNG